MPVASQNKQARPTVLYGLLARQALESLDTDGDGERAAYLNNFVRLIERYRYGAFNDVERRGILDRRAFNRREAKARRSEFLKLTSALDSARTVVFRRLSKDRASAKLIGILTTVSGGARSISKPEIKQLRGFIEEFQRNLRVG